MIRLQFGHVVAVAEEGQYTNLQIRPQFPAFANLAHGVGYDTLRAMTRTRPGACAYSLRSIRRSFAF